MPANYVLIQETTVTTAASSVTLSNIPQTGYTDLKLVSSARTTTGGVTGMLIRFNGDTGSNYKLMQIQSNGSTASSNSGTDTSMYGGLTNGSTDTASTFSNTEMYISNYLVTGVQKVVTIDSVTENNNTTAYINPMSNAWTGTAAINTILLTNASGANFAVGSSFSLYGIAAVGTTPTVLPKASGGDIVTNDGTYWYHTFLASSAFIPNQTLTCDFLVIAGGGGGAGVSSGGSFSAPGGGAGGYRTSVGTSGGGGSAESPLSLLAQSYPVTVGAGGTANLAGSNSVFSTITSNGGGGAPAGSGGSGSGSFNFGTLTPGAGTNNQGYAGAAASGNTSSGGGGGAGGAGSSSTTGGAGLTSSISGSSVARAGGGAAGWGGTATAGGGAGGAAGANSNGTSGSAFTGGGGGGGTANTGTGLGGNGGSGIVVIRYTMA